MPSRPPSQNTRQTHQGGQQGQAAPICVIGIDPGLDGAVAVLAPGDIDLHDTPTVKTATKREFMVAEMVAILRPYAESGAVAVLEMVSGRPGQGTASARSIGLGFGLWYGILAALNVPVEIVQPAVWKRAFSLLKCDKKASRLRAQQLFPATVDQLARVKDEGRAEALLMAEWLRRRRGDGR